MSPESSSGRPAVAVFVSGHGYGHAARACAVVDELHGLIPDLSFHLIGRVPRWFLQESLAGVPWSHHVLGTDFGPVQRTSLEIDLEATRERLLGRIPPADETVDATVALVERIAPRLILADVVPTALLAGARCGVPSVLVENFTWDWIYRRLLPGDPGVEVAAAWLEDAYAQASLRVQTRPCCHPVPGARQVGGIARRPRRSRAAIRSELGIGDDEVMALLSMGGVPWRYRGLDTAGGVDRLRPVVVGEVDRPLPEGFQQLGHHSRLHHPDLVAAADVLVGKLGYSTLAEAWQAGCAYSYVERSDFPEIPCLERHVREVLPSARLRSEDLQTGAWAEIALETAARTGPRSPFADGRPEAAEAIAALLGG